MHKQTTTAACGELFDRSIDGLASEQPTPVVEVADDGVFDIDIAPVRMRIGDSDVRMIAYNGCVPGPTLRVRQHATVTVNVTNRTDSDQTVHWHGLRLDNRYDGVPYDTQKPIAPGERFTYQLRFPDAGLYWYHPHIREDYGQEMGLYANIVVDPADGEHWPPVDRELVITLDDVLLDGGHMAPFHRDGPTHTMMGRFGNVMLTAGEPFPSYEVQQGEVVRLYLTNTANVRVFNLAIPSAVVKLVGGDSGRVEHELILDRVVLAPSERAIVDVLFAESGPVPLQNATPVHTDTLATFAVRSSRETRRRDAFFSLRRDAQLGAERAALASHRGRPSDYTLRFVGEMQMSGADHEMTGMHHAMAEMDHDGMASGDDGIEWDDEMPEMNATSDTANMAWRLIDAATGAVNHDIDWTLRVGDRVKITLDNAAGGDHQMHHPFHIHGAGRFLVLDRDGVEDANLVWKDTVLVPGGQSVTILFDVTNPGRWMAHCHIAEHAEAGMMFSFDVLPTTAAHQKAP
jgi:FtsP/CotA-like multicopper oxidase with cupredoxin domain